MAVDNRLDEWSPEALTDSTEADNVACGPLT